MDNQILIQNITKHYKNGRGISNISLQIKEGEVFGLLGSNGSGKTTLMKTMCGLVHADAGETRVFGQRIKSYDNKALSCTSAMIESPSLFLYLTAYKNMEIAARYYSKKIDSKTIDAALKDVGLLGYKNEKVGNFSLGMKQRLGIALTMLPNPKFYILDEPTNGLDIEGTSEIMEIIHQLAQTKKATFLISSHIASELEKICDTIGVMQEGVLLHIVSMDFIKENYASLQDYYMNTVKSKKGGGVPIGTVYWYN